MSDAEGPAEGPRAVRMARRAVEEALEVPASERTPSVEEGPLPEAFHEPRGAFVTIRIYPGGRLRGCIGYPMPVLPLQTAVRRAAVGAALQDPRFRPIGPADLPRLTFEVSLLSVPQPVSAPPGGSIADTVRAGRDGVIVEGFRTSGLLLPQVATELGWGAEELLDGACEKAGLPPGTWQDPRVRVRTFEASVFAERSPGGPVEQEPTEAPPRGAPSAPKS